MRYAGKAVCLVMCNGDIIAAYEDDDEAEGKAFAINNNNAETAAREAGYDTDDLSDSEAAEFAFKGGFDGYAYVEYVQIPEEEDDEDDGNFSRTDEDTEFFTSEGDTLTYGDVISAIDAMYANEDDDTDEDDEDSDEEGSDISDDPDYYF